MGGMRASDRERQATVRALRGQLRNGRLSDVTFVRRMMTALDARRRTELDYLVADLPSRSPVRKSAVGGVPSSTVSTATLSDPNVTNWSTRGFPAST